MKKHLLRFPIIFLMSCVFLFSGTAYADVKVAEQTSFLFIQNAKTGMLQRDKTKPGNYQFILKNVSPYVIYFSDRPKRISGLMPPEKFVQLWQKQAKNKANFSAMAPNVGVNAIQVHHVINKQDFSFVMVLSAPVYNKAQHSITYAARFVTNNNQAKLPAVNTTLHDVVLFFDNILDPCTDSSCCPLC